MDIELKMKISRIKYLEGMVKNYNINGGMQYLSN